MCKYTPLHLHSPTKQTSSSPDSHAVPHLVRHKGCFRWQDYRFHVRHFITGSERHKSVLHCDFIKVILFSSDFQTWGTSCCLTWTISCFVFLFSYLCFHPLVLDRHGVMTLMALGLTVRTDANSVSLTINLKPQEEHHSIKLSPALKCKQPCRRREERNLPVFLCGGSHRQGGSGWLQPRSQWTFSGCWSGGKAEAVAVVNRFGSGQQQWDCGLVPKRPERWWWLKMTSGCTHLPRWKIQEVRGKSKKMKCARHIL